MLGLKMVMMYLEEKSHSAEDGKAVASNPSGNRCRGCLGDIAGLVVSCHLQTFGDFAPDGVAGLVVMVQQVPLAGPVRSGALLQLASPAPRMVEREAKGINRRWRQAHGISQHGWFDLYIVQNTESLEDESMTSYAFQKVICGTQIMRSFNTRLDWVWEWWWWWCFGVKVVSHRSH